MGECPDADTRDPGRGDPREVSHVSGRLDPLSDIEIINTELSLAAGNRNIQVAVCHQPFTTAAAMLTGKLRKTPFLYIFHSPSHEEFQIATDNVGPITKACGSFIRRVIELYCLRKAQTIITLSGYMRDRLATVHRINKSRVVINPGGVDLDRFTPPSSHISAKRKLGLPGERIHLLSVRNLEPRMGIDMCFKTL